MVSLFSGLMAKTDNFCEDLEDWGPVYNRAVNVSVCKTVLEKNCTQFTDRQCMEVTEVECEVELFTNCSMDWEDYPGVDYTFNTKNATLRTCWKMLKNISHEKTLHRCENVTKQHCTTIWKENEAGEKVWAGNEDDCRDVTWEECKPVKVNVTIPAPGMNCTEYPQPYLDYEVKPVTLRADSMKCEVDKRTVCKPVKKQKCGRINYTQCLEVNTTHYSLHTTHYSLHTTLYTLHTENYTLHTLLRTRPRQD